MSLWSNLLDTHEVIKPATGLIPSGAPDDLGNPVLKALLPLYHTTLKVTIDVTLDEHGNLCAPIEKTKNGRWIIIPCTEESMGRSGTQPVPHPLCDQLQYVDSACDSQRTDKYLEQLDNWRGDNVKLNAIYRYVSQNSIIEDATRQGLQLSASKDKAAGVCFHVQFGESNPNVAEDDELRNRWINYQHERGKKIGVGGFDMFGRTFQNFTMNYPKNIVTASGAANAKLISANDDKNCTFRGRFIDKTEALWLDADTVQKLYVTLRWLANNHGLKTGSQEIIIWSIDHPMELVVDPQMDSKDTCDAFEELFPQIDDETVNPVVYAAQVTDIDYAERFSKFLRGYGNGNFLKRHNSKMTIAILDAATSGRLSVTFYRELQESEYIESIMRWHESVAWHLTHIDTSDGTTKVVRFIGAPSFNDIISCASDIADRSSDEYKRFAKNVKKRLVECMFGDKTLPRSILDASYHKVTRPLGYADLKTWNRQLEIACSLWKQYFITQSNSNPEQKEVTMELDAARTDRDYLYGRLLALADHFEHRAMYKQGIDGTRPTNAVKLMSNFTSKPYATWGTLMKQLVPYLKAANGAPWFQNDVDEVMSLFHAGDYEDNRPLSPLFLLGYSHQRRYLERAAEAKNRENNN